MRRGVGGACSNGAKQQGVGLVPAVDVKVFHAGDRAAPPGIVEENVQSTKLGHRPFNGSLDLQRLGYVAGCEGHCAVGLLFQVAANVVLQVRRNHLGSFCHKEFQSGKANARAGTRDDGDFSLKAV